MASQTLRISEVATRAGVNRETLRYYERRGILAAPRRSRAGYRQYPEDAVRLIRFIKRAQELGFTLEQVEELVKLRRTSARDREKVRVLAAAKLEEIDEKIRQLKAMSTALASLVGACGCSAGAIECPILEALEDAPEGDHDV